MSVMTNLDNQRTYAVEEPDGSVILVEPDGEGGARYYIGDGATRHWTDEDEVVEAVEMGLTYNEEWLSDHNDWELEVK